MVAIALNLLACAEPTPDPPVSTPAPNFDYVTENVHMVALEAGEFDMGPDDFNPAHHVTLTHPFWMSRTEVTQGVYLRLAGFDPSAATTCGEDCPVEQTSWTAGAFFANLLSIAEGLPKCYFEDGNELLDAYVQDPYACEGYRMPTEAEWEYAARAGGSGPYAGSDDVDAVAWYEENSEGTPHPVAQLPPNAWGLHDMAGNVWEWTTEHYVFFSEEPATDPFASTMDPARVNRGGGWNGGENVCDVTYRGAREPSYAMPNLGLRMVRTRHE